MKSILSQKLLKNLYRSENVLQTVHQKFWMGLVLRDPSDIRSVIAEQTTGYNYCTQEDNLWNKEEYEN